MTMVKGFEDVSENELMEMVGSEGGYAVAGAVTGVILGAGAGHSIGQQAASRCMTIPAKIAAYSIITGVFAVAGGIQGYMTGAGFDQAEKEVLSEVTEKNKKSKESKKKTVSSGS